MLERRKFYVVQVTTKFLENDRSKSNKIDKLLK